MSLKTNVEEKEIRTSFWEAKEWEKKKMLPPLPQVVAGSVVGVAGVRVGTGQRAGTCQHIG